MAIEEWRASGLPREEWCSQRGLQPRTMKWWEGVLARGGRSPSVREQPPRFVEVTGVVPRGDDRIELEVAGVRARLGASFDEQALGRVLAALGVSR